jgi:hypothetical protein
LAIIGVCLSLAVGCNRGVESSSADNNAPPPNSGLPAPPPPPSSAFIARLTPEQTTQLKTLGAPLVVPTAIPAGFTVEQVAVKQDDRFSGYRILYRDEGDRCFLVEYTSGGVGGIPKTEGRLPIKLPILSPDADFGLNYGHYEDPNLRAQFPDPELISDWLPISGGFYRFVGATYINNSLVPDASCKDVAVEEAATILESFAEITDEIRGDGLPSESP